MKINKYLYIITLLLLFSKSAFCQFDRYDVRTLKMVDDEFLIDKDLYTFRSINPPCNCVEDFNFWGDTGFGGSNFAALNAALMVEAQRIAALEEWYHTQRGLIKDEIVEYYNLRFNSCNEAVGIIFIYFVRLNYSHFD